CWPRWRRAAATMKSQRNCSWALRRSKHMFRTSWPRLLHATGFRPWSSRTARGWPTRPTNVYSWHLPRSGETHGGDVTPGHHPAGTKPTNLRRATDVRDVVGQYGYRYDR